MATMAALNSEGRAAASRLQTPYHWAAAYGVVAVVLLGIGAWGKPPERDEEDAMLEEKAPAGD
jgi:hypothetical protein